MLGLRTFVAGYLVHIFSPMEWSNARPIRSGCGGTSLAGAGAQVLDSGAARAPAPAAAFARRPVAHLLL